jgi:hypothetical protein
MVKLEQIHKTREGCCRLLSSDTHGQLNVFGLDRDPLGVDGAQICVLKNGDNVGFQTFLERL